MNKYKIDYNRYGYDFPFSLFSKAGLFKPWKVVATFKTIEEAIKVFEKLDGMPIYLKSKIYTLKN